MRLIFIFCFMIFVTSAHGQNKSDSLEFSINFTDCFDNDLISVKLNGEFISSLNVLTTDKSDGITGLYIYQNSQNLYVAFKKDKLKLKRVRLHNNPSIDIIINGKSNVFSLNTAKGKYLLFDKCGVRSKQGEYKLHLTQVSKAPEFD